MYYPSEKDAIAFADNVKEAVEEVLSDLGFTTRVDSSTLPRELYRKVVYAESTIWQIRLFLSYSSVNVAMRLMSEARAKDSKDVKEPPRPITRESFALPLPPSEHYVDLYYILNVLSPQLSEEDRYPRKLISGDMIRTEIDRQLRLIVEHCMPMLQGDLTLWAKVRDAERYSFGSRQMEDESRADYIERLRETAESAMQANEYWRASRFYGQVWLVTGRLTFREKLKFRRAKKHIFYLV